MARPATVVIDSSALQHNLSIVQSRSPKAKILAMIKANGYGHGSVIVAKALAKADAFGVCCIEEALELRAAGITHPVVLMEGVFKSEELTLAAEQQFEIVVHHLQQVEQLEQATLPNPLKVWLKLDTGMHRLGFTPNIFLQAYQRLLNCPQVFPTLKLMTHFSSSDELDSDTTIQQAKLFEEITKNLPGEKSLSNSGGILGWQNSAVFAGQNIQDDWVRPGLMLYGLSPFAGTCGRDFDLKPVMTLRSELIAIHQLNKGERVGYGGKFTCPESMKIGTVAMGYADGYPRNAGNGTTVLVNHKPVSLIGRVSMDMLAVDLRTQPNAKVGNEVILWGQDLPMELIAFAAGQSVYEIASSVHQRLPMVIAW